MSVEGTIAEFQQSGAIGGTGVQTPIQVPMGAGWLLGFAVTVPGSTLFPGGIYGRVSIGHQQGATFGPMMVLAQGDISSVLALGMGTQRNPPNTQPVTLTTGANPAAGAEISQTVPASERWKIKSVTVTLVTSAVVANRLPRLIYTRSGTEYMRAPAGAVVAASITATLCWANFGMTQNNSVSAIQCSLPDAITLDLSDVIATSTLSLDPGDDYGAPVYAYERV